MSVTVFFAGLSNPLSRFVRESKAGERSSPINCKVEASDPTNFCNQTFNSRAAVFDSFLSGSVKSLIIVGREDRVQILHSYRAARAATVRRVAAPYKCAPIKLYGVRRQMISAHTVHLFTIHFYLLP